LFFSPDHFSFSPFISIIPLPFALFIQNVFQAQSQKAAYSALQQHADALALELKTSRQETQAAVAKAAAPEKPLNHDRPETSQAIASAAEAQVLAQLNREVEARTGPLVARCHEAEHKLRLAEEALARARSDAKFNSAAAAAAAGAAAGAGKAAAADEQSPSSSSPHRRSDSHKNSHSPSGKKHSSASKREDWVRASALQACEDKLSASETIVLKEREQHAAAMSDLASSHEAELAQLWQRYQAAVVAHQEEASALQAELQTVNERAVDTAKYLSAWREAEVGVVTRKCTLNLY
jgi:hypothetical protein